VIGLNGYSFKYRRRNGANCSDVFLFTAGEGSLYLNPFYGGLFTPQKPLVLSERLRQITKSAGEGSPDLNPFYWGHLTPPNLLYYQSAFGKLPNPALARSQSTEAEMSVQLKKFAEGEKMKYFDNTADEGAPCPNPFASLVKGLLTRTHLHRW
jgi:hypothetical protein